jgi:hypothetical protein
MLTPAALCAEAAMVAAHPRIAPRERPATYRTGRAVAAPSMALNRPAETGQARTIDEVVDAAKSDLERHRRFEISWFASKTISVYQVDATRAPKDIDICDGEYRVESHESCSSR